MYEHCSIARLHASFREGALSCEDIVRYYLQQIQHRSELNAFVDVYSEEALARARSLDQRRSEGHAMGKLHGVVVGVKDIISHKGHRLTAGSKILEGFRPIYNATAIDRILQEEAIIIGSLNCDEFGMGSSNEHSCYGKVLNPLDPERVPGGSSGGSAAAVAAGLCMVSLGSDTGGSVRQPADFCGIMGIKPGYGRISRHGLIAYASSFDQIGILGLCSYDLAVMLEVMAGKDDFDSTASPHPVPAYTSLLEEKPVFKIAYFNQAIHHPALDPEIAAGIHTFLKGLIEQGHTVEGIDVDFIDYIVPAYYILTTAEASSNLSRYDGIRYGHSTETNIRGLDDYYKKSRSEGFGKEVKRRIMLGTFVLSAGFFDAYYTRAQQARQKIMEKTQTIFQEFDLIVMPTSPQTAFKFGEKSADAVSMFLADIFTVYANLAGIAGISFPVGKHSNGMPFGVQGLSDKHAEWKLLQFGQHQRL